MKFYQNLKNAKAPKKAAKCLAVFCVLILTAVVIFSSPQDVSSGNPTTSTDCKSLASGTTAQPGNNCLFSSMVPNGSQVLPLCSNINGNVPYTIDPNNILATGAPRLTCNDLSDLHICSSSNSSDITGKNCAKICDSSFNCNAGATRGVDCAIHNLDCIRFCDSPESGVTANAATNCTYRRCHQLDDGVVPIASPASGYNCTLLPCNLLTPEELIVVDKKISDDINNSRTVGKYCDGTLNSSDQTLKCYHFNAAQLRYVDRSHMCTIHNCPPPSYCPNYNSATDVNGDGVINAYDNNDTLNISDRDKNGTTDSDTSYVTAYNKAINGGLELTDTSYCTPVICRPIINKQYRCVSSLGGSSATGTNQDIYTNQSCDQSGNGSICSSDTNYMCYKTIDCNDPANTTKYSECAVDGDTTSFSDDTTKSWFYRPKPHHDAVDGNGNLRDFDAVRMCYTKDQMRVQEDDSPDGHWGLYFKIDMSWLFGAKDIVEYYHSYLLPDRTRSPGICDAKNNDGARGTGYVYLCKGDGNINASIGPLYSKVSDQTAFHKGYVATTFTEGDAEHKVTVCLRFRNYVRPDDGAHGSETCGSRNCGISCAFGRCDSKVCGRDVCRDLIIKDSDPVKCKMTGTVAEGSVSNKHQSNDCMQIIDDYLRLRIQKYGNRICSFLDVKGQTAYTNKGPDDPISNLFMKGDEKLSDGTCMSGSANQSGNCDGKSSFDNPGLTTIWRTIKFGDEGHIPYIQNNRPAGETARGYFDKDLQFYAEQDCIHVPLRVPPPKLYNLATVKNSAKLFTPPLYVSNAMTKLGGSISPQDANNNLGSTDFNSPSLQVTFGNTTQEIGLDFGVTGYEVPNTVITLTTTAHSLPYSVDVFVRKEFNETTLQPTFCLYRKMVDLTGVEIDPVVIGCVKRNFPEINNAAARASSPTSAIDPKKIVIYPDPTNTFDSSRIALRYLGGFGANGRDDNCAAGSDDLCSTEMKLDNVDSKIPTCTSAIFNKTNPSTLPVEVYNVCVQREECSQLNVECIKNEIDLQNAKIAGQDTSSFKLIRNYCNNQLLPLCNAKKGITATGGTITNTNPTGASISPTAYGWFNELCFVSGDKTNGFNNQLKMVVAYASVGATKGKCLINTSTSTGDCSAGGKAPNCNCITYDSDSTSISSGQEVRLQTPREAGLCIDMPEPTTCASISYNPSPTLPYDPDYIYSSMNLNASNIVPSTYGTSYNDITGVVHISHKYRDQGDHVAGSALDGNGHADFPISVLGQLSVEGQCKGFWKSTVSGSGIPVSPTRSCLNINGNAQWDSNVTNACVRYSCPEIATTGATSEIDGSSYQGGYASSESGDAKGSSAGFATWPATTKTTDFLEYASATACIPGFKKKGSTAILDSNNKITGYAGGISPTRACNQIGQWQTTSNACERITCPASSPPIPSSTTDTVNWQKWYDSGGATFPRANASRSTRTGVMVTGTCNNSLGFFNLGDPPTRRCNYLGNWEPIQNPCTTRCDAIDAAHANNSNNGNATWGEVNTAISAAQAGTFKGCISGYYPYPYPPLKNLRGTPFQLARGNISAASYSFPDQTVATIAGNADLSNNSIPLDVSTDSRTAGNPEKYCLAVIYDGVTTNTWAAATSSCINSCPGYLDDPRVGVGTTQHDTSNGKITVRWPSGTFGRWYYYISSDSSYNANRDAPLFNGKTAADFAKDRNNKLYIIARFCGDGFNNSSTIGKWSDPIPQCATNNGVITEDGTSSNALYNTSSPHTGSVTSNSYTVNINDTATTTSCMSSNYGPTGSDSTPVAISSYQCTYKTDNFNIDEMYFHKVGGKSCQVYCTPPEVGTIYGNSKYDGRAPAYTAVGTKINLVCKDSNFGKAPDNDPDTSDNNCGRANSDRGSSPSTITCQPDGTFGNLQNDCTACADCAASNASNTLNPNSLDTDYSNFDKNCGKNHTFTTYFSDDNCSFAALKHGGTASCSDSDKFRFCDALCGSCACDKSYTMTGSFGVTCSDGRFILTSSSCAGRC